MEGVVKSANEQVFGERLVTFIPAHVSKRGRIDEYVRHILDYSKPVTHTEIDGWEAMEADYNRRARYPIDKLWAKHKEDERILAEQIEIATELEIRIFYGLGLFRFLRNRFFIPILTITMIA